MGCASAKEGKKESKKPQILDQKDEKTAAAPAQKPKPTKLTTEEVEAKRDTMKKLLQEGSAKPPAFTAPKIGIINSIETQQ